MAMKAACHMHKMGSSLGRPKSCSKPQFHSHKSDVRKKSDRKEFFPLNGISCYNLILRFFRSRNFVPSLVLWNFVPRSAAVGQQRELCAGARSEANFSKCVKLTFWANKRTPKDSRVDDAYCFDMNMVLFFQTSRFANPGGEIDLHQQSSAINFQ